MACLLELSWSFTKPKCHQSWAAQAPPEGICLPDAISASALYCDKGPHLNPEKTKGQLPQGWHFIQTLTAVASPEKHKSDAFNSVRTLEFQI